jgi:hypothetical protein
LVQTEGEVEALRVVVATSIFDGEGIASEPLNWVLLRVILGDPQRLEFLWEKQIVKSSREGGESVVFACRGGLLASYFFNSVAGIVASARGTSDVAICVASASAVASATGSPASPVLGAPAAAASAASITMISSAETTAGTASTVTTLRRPAGRSPGTVGVLGQFSSSTVAFVVCWTTTCGFMVVGFTSSEGRHLSDSVVDSHEAGVLRELGNNFTCTHPLSLMCYRGDRHEALLGGSLHLAFDLIKYLCEVPYWEAFTETSTPFVLLPIALTSGILVVVGFIRGCIGRQLVC